MYLFLTAHKRKTFYSDLAVLLRHSATWYAQKSSSQPLWNRRVAFVSQNKPSLLNFVFTRQGYCPCSLLPRRLSYLCGAEEEPFISTFPMSSRYSRAALSPALSSLTGSSCSAWLYYFKLPELENFARVNHFSFLLLQLEAS